MSDSDESLLEAFESWLGQLGRDAELLGSVLGATELDVEARKAAAGGLNYLFKSLDLIPDGIDDIGYLDDAFVLRVAADLAVAADDGKSADALRAIGPLANDADVVREFLGKDYARLESYVKGLKKG